MHNMFKAIDHPTCLSIVCSELVFGLFAFCFEPLNSIKSLHRSKTVKSSSFSGAYFWIVNLTFALSMTKTLTESVPNVIVIARSFYCNKHGKSSREKKNYFKLKTFML